jgi:hypothetical protein
LTAAEAHSVADRDVANSDQGIETVAAIGSVDTVGTVAAVAAVAGRYN